MTECSCCGNRQNQEESALLLLDGRVPVCSYSCADQIQQTLACARCAPPAEECLRISHRDPRLHITGRYDRQWDSDAGGELLVQDWPCCSWQLCVTGTRIVGIEMDSGGSYFDVLLDGQHRGILCTYKHTVLRYYQLPLPRLSRRQQYSIRLVKRNEPYLDTTLHRYGPVRLACMVLERRATPLWMPPLGTRHRIEWLGDSDLAGLGNESRISTLSTSLCLRGDLQSADQAFGAVCSRLLGADYQILAWSGKGVTRQQSLFVGLDKLPELYLRCVAQQRDSPEPEWQRWVPSLVVLYCGANDFTHWPRATAEDFTQGYARLVQLVRSRRPLAQICCLTLANWRHLTAQEWGTIQQWHASSSLTQGVHTAVCALRDPRCYHLELELEEPLDPAQDYGLLRHWNLQGHAKVARSLARELRQRLRLPQ